SIAVVRDRRAGTVSMVLRVVGEGFPVASLREQDAMVGAWGAALAPLARARCAVSKVTWQEWAHPIGVAGHRQFLIETSRPSDTSAAIDYEELLVTQAPFTIAHEVLLTVTVDLKRVRARRHSSQQAVAVETVTDEIRLLTSRLEAAGLQVEAPLSPAELSAAIRLRSDPTRATQLGSLRRSLASAVGRGAIEWGPMAVDADWFHTRVDQSVHRSYRVGSWPMLPVTADWLTPLLTGDGAVRTVTVVMEPVALSRAAADANRQLTSIEADQSQKERHGFRLTARDRRRHADVETRERELAEGHPEFRHIGIVTVTADDLDGLEDAAARVEQAAAQSMLDLRPLAARQSEGWVASLPLGRSVRNGTWT
ncbi:MAG: SCO6880 family protein, partial [Ilumatobacteraceae bacterium]